MCVCGREGSSKSPPKFDLQLHFGAMLGFNSSCVAIIKNGGK